MPSSPEKLSLQVCPPDRWPELRADWAAVAEASPYTSFFLLPEWTEAWLATCTAGLNVRILLFRHGEQPVGACLAVRKTVRRGGIPVRRVYLNTAGEDERDDTCIEFNNLLCLEGWEEAVARGLAEDLDREKWDELMLNGFSAGPPLDALRAALSQCEASQEICPSHYVDLDAIRDSATSYEESLGPTTRKHLRQNYRHYAKLGDLQTGRAATLDEALSMLDELAALHQESWQRRGRPGAFASSSFTAFHRTLIRKTFASGGTQLFRVTAGEVVGLIYAFVYRRKVYFYQSGLRYSDDKRLSPGQVVNASVINACLEAGWSEYDFLAGDAPYKKSLGPCARDLTWVVLRRPGWKLRTIDLLRGIKAVTRRSVRNTPLPTG
jgi:CelD/BcsL family acetyltransferase involved in cellulose biosynthesis